VFFPELESST